MTARLGRGLALMAASAAMLMAVPQSGASPAARTVATYRITVTGLSEARLSAAEAPTIPFRPIALRGQYLLTFWIPVVGPGPVLGRLVSGRHYSCTGRAAGFPEATFTPSVSFGSARRMRAFLDRWGKSLPAAVKRQWSALATQQDAYVTQCVVEWEDSRRAAGKTVRATYVIGGSSGIPAARRSFSFGPMCDWYDKQCQTQGYVPTR